MSNNIFEIFNNMEYCESLEDTKEAIAWLEKEKYKLGPITSNDVDHSESCKTKIFENVLPFEAKCKAIEYIIGGKEIVTMVTKNAEKFFDQWKSLTGHERAKHLYSIARHIQKNSQLLTILEALSCDRNVNSVKEHDIPYVTQLFYYCAGLAEIREKEFPNREPCGVAGIYISSQNSLLSLVKVLGSALANGSVVVAIIDISSSPALGISFLADICKESGLPSGILNIVYVEDLVPVSQGFNHLSIFGSPSKCKKFFQLVADDNERITDNLHLELNSNVVIIVFEKVDIDSAVEGIIEGFSANGRLNSKYCKLLVQTSIYDKLIDSLKSRMDKLRYSRNVLDKSSDMKYICERTKTDYGSQTVAVYPKDKNGVACLITGCGSSDDTETTGFFSENYIKAAPFRTAKEAITIANDSVYGLSASIFTEDISLALETAKLIKTGTVWINCHGKLNPAVGLGGCKSSGFGTCGGMEGFVSSMKPKDDDIVEDKLKTLTDNKIDFIPSHDKNIDCTYKLYYGGAQKRPDSGKYYNSLDCDGISYADIPLAGGKDVHNAVSAAGKVQPSWEKRSGFNRSQIIYYLAENLNRRRTEFIDHLIKTGLSNDDASKEFDSSVSRLFFWAAYADKYGGKVQENPSYGYVMQVNEAVGTIGILCPRNAPLLAFVSTMAPAIARGNAVVMIPSEQYPVIGLIFQQVLESSDVPSGVVNILSGSSDVLAKCLAEHRCVQHMWYFGSSSDISAFQNGLGHKCWISCRKRHWFEAHQEEFLLQSSHIKNIWMPMGEIFAN